MLLKSPSITRNGDCVINHYPLLFHRAGRLATARMYTICSKMQALAQPEGEPPCALAPKCPAYFAGTIALRQLGVLSLKPDNFLHGLHEQRLQLLEATPGNILVSVGKACLSSLPGVLLLLRVPAAHECLAAGLLPACTRASFGGNRSPEPAPSAHYFSYRNILGGIRDFRHAGATARRPCAKIKVYNLWRWLRSHICGANIETT